jgi:hypothetical protein
MNYFYFNFIYNVIFLIPEEVVTSEEEGDSSIIFLSPDSAFEELSEDSEASEAGLVSSSLFSSSTSKIFGFILNSLLVLLISEPGTYGGEPGTYGGEPDGTYVGEPDGTYVGEPGAY